MPSRTAAGIDAFGRQPIAHRKGRGLAGFRQTADQGAMAFRRTGDKAAAMEIKNDPSRRRLGMANPFAGNGAELAGTEIQPRRRLAEAGEQGGEMGAQLVNVADRGAPPELRVHIAMLQNSNSFAGQSNKNARKQKGGTPQSRAPPCSMISPPDG